MAEKVSFNIASEASYVYILSGQKFIENAIFGPIWRVFENLKIAVKQNVNVARFARNDECDFFCDFQTLFQT